MKKYAVKSKITELNRSSLELKLTPIPITNPLQRAPFPTYPADNFICISSNKSAEENRGAA